MTPIDDAEAPEPAAVVETARRRLAGDVAALRRKARPGRLLTDAGQRAVARARSLATNTRLRIRTRPAPWVAAGVAVGAVALAAAWMRRRSSRAG